MQQGSEWWTVVWWHNLSSLKLYHDENNEPKGESDKFSMLGEWEQGTAFLWIESSCWKQCGRGTVLMWLFTLWRRGGEVEIWYQLHICIIRIYVYVYQCLFNVYKYTSYIYILLGRWGAHYAVLICTGPWSQQLHAQGRCSILMQWRYVYYDDCFENIVYWATIIGIAHSWLKETSILFWLSLLLGYGKWYFCFVLFLDTEMFSSMP